MYGKWLPPLISAQAAGIDRLILVVHVLMLVLFIGWGTFFVICLYKFRRQEGRKALYEPVKGTLTKYVEVGVLVSEIIILFLLSMPIWAAYRKVPTDEEFQSDEKFKKPAVNIVVTGQQFKWSAHYPGADGKMGKTDIQYVSEDSNPVGLDPGDTDGKDDLVPPKIGMCVLALPTETPIVIHLRSKDVIHSFFFPVARIKQDAIPGMETPIWFKLESENVEFTTDLTLPDKQVLKVGKYDVACAQLCGKGHSSMNMQVYVMKPDDYQKWLAGAAKEEEFNEGELK